jgi:hypothetical protein
MTGAWRCLLFGSTASLALATAVPPPARAAEVLPGGALDITLSGFVRFLSTYGAWDDTQLDPGRAGSANSDRGIGGVSA